LVVDSAALAGKVCYVRIETLLPAMLQDENLQLLRCRGHHPATGPGTGTRKFLKF
jgi:hypothetical protein